MHIVYKIFLYLILTFSPCVQIFSMCCSDDVIRVKIPQPRTIQHTAATWYQTELQSFVNRVKAIIQQELLPIYENILYDPEHSIYIAWDIDDTLLAHTNCPPKKSRAHCGGAKIGRAHV